MKLYFLRPSETCLADPDTTAIESIKSELLQRPGVIEAKSYEDADAIILREPFSFKEWRYISKLLEDPVVGRHPNKIYTINSDDAGTGLLRGVYSGLPLRQLDPAIHRAVPYLFQPNELVLQLAGSPRPQPTYLATWRGNLRSNPLRGRLVDICSRSPAFRAETSESWLDHGEDEKRIYVELLLSGRFSLCPGGWTPATFRIYESMTLGIAPVLIADEYAPPAGPNWSEFSLKLAEADLPHIERELNKHTERYVEMGQRAHEAWQQYFRPDLLVSYYSDALLSCIHSSVGKGSRADEIKRWKSPQMYRANRWTISQRVENRIGRVAAQFRSRFTKA